MLRMDIGAIKEEKATIQISIIGNYLKGKYTNSNRND